MELVTSQQQLKHGVMIMVKGKNREVVFEGQVVGFPYSNGPHGRSANGTPDMVLIHIGKKDEAKRLAELGLGQRAYAERRTYIIDP